MRVFVIGRDGLPPEFQGLVDALNQGGEQQTAGDMSPEPEMATDSATSAQDFFDKLFAGEEEQPEQPDAQQEHEDAIFVQGYAAAYGICLGCAPEGAQELISDLILRLRDAGQLVEH